MLDFLFKKEAGNACENLNSFYSNVKRKHSFESITEERKEYLNLQDKVRLSSLSADKSIRRIN